MQGVQVNGWKEKKKKNSKTKSLSEKIKLGNTLRWKTVCFVISSVEEVFLSSYRLMPVHRKYQLQGDCETLNHLHT